MSGVRITRRLGLAGVLGGASWVAWAVQGDDWPALLAPVLVAFLGTLWALQSRFALDIGRVGTLALATGALGLVIMLLGAAVELVSATDADPVLVAGGIVAVTALVVAGVLGARRLEGAPQWLLALSAGSFSAIPLWEVSFGLGFALLGAAVAWPAPETLALKEETA